MSVDTPGMSYLRTVKLRNHHLRLLISAQDGRILEVESLRTGRHLVSWWPFALAEPSRAGGIGPCSDPAGGSPWKLRELPDRVSFSRTLEGGIVIKRGVYLPPDSLVFHVSLTVENESDATRTVVLDEGAALCPGFGGRCPEPAGGILHCRHRAFLKRPGNPVEDIPYEVFERVHVERDDLEWAAFNDPLGDELLCAILPGGHVTLSTEYHWWLRWTRTLRLAPGEKAGFDFHYACTPSMDLPMVAGEHVLAGISGETVPLGGPRPLRARVFGLDTTAGGPVSISYGGKRIVEGKPLPEGREGFEAALPEYDGSREVKVEISVAGKYGEAWLDARRCRELYRELDEICEEAASSAESGDMPRGKAATVLACRRIVDANGDKSAAELEGIIAAALARAKAVLASPLDDVAFYSESESLWQLEAARNIDMPRLTKSLAETLMGEFDLEVPRFRQARPEAGVLALSRHLLEAALALSVRRDDALLHAWRTRLGELTRLWARCGEVCYETIHHGVMLAHVIPAYAIALRHGWLTPAEEAEVQAMILDVCGKIRRRGGVQFRLSNWWAMEAAPLAYAGALFPYLPEADEYMSLARGVFYWLLAHGTFADGGFWEMSASYHTVTLEYLCHIAEAFLRRGEDLYREETCGRRLAEMVAFVEKISIPWGRLPAFEDSSRDLNGEVFLTAAKRMEDGLAASLADAAFARDKRDRGAHELFVAHRAPPAAEPRRDSEVLVPSGKAILRSPDGELTMILDFGAHGGWHGHRDKLSFELFWRDMCIVPDAGSYKYEEVLQWSWFKRSIAHNTVTLGDDDQLEVCGRLVEFDKGADAACAVVEARTYLGVIHRREVTVENRALVIDDYMDNVPLGTSIVWRMNTFTPPEVDGDKAAVAYGDLRMTISFVTGGAHVAAAKVPLIGEESQPGAGYVTGWQVRASKPAQERSERKLTRIDFDWRQ